MKGETGFGPLEVNDDRPVEFMKNQNVEQTPEEGLIQKFKTIRTGSWTGGHSPHLIHYI